MPAPPGKMPGDTGRARSSVPEPLADDIAIPHTSRVARAMLRSLGETSVERQRGRTDWWVRRAPGGYGHDDDGSLV